jgi:hypothetical protein
MTLPTFKIIAPAIRSVIPVVTVSEGDTEYPIHPIFKLAWDTLLEEKYAELEHIMIRQSGVKAEEGQMFIT